MKAALRLALASLVLSSLSACSGSPAASVDVSFRCPPVASDIVAESQRKPVVKGDTAAEAAANLIIDGHRKNAALRRVIGSYDECRKS
jgi:hypothetical protein